MEMEYRAQGAPQTGLAHRPTGFRRLTMGSLQADRAANAFAGLPEGVSKPGQLLAACKAAAPRLGLSMRLVHAIDWLFRFTQPQDWEEGARPIVWPSAETQQIGLGLSPTQVKAINRQLIETGLLTMRDSPNGKRYGRRDRQSRIIEAYGFDLAPLAARHAEFLRLAKEERLERQLVGRLRRRATIARKGIAQLLETAREYGFTGEEWRQLAEETQHILQVLRMASLPEDMQCGVVSLEHRQTAARTHLEALLGVVDSVPKEAENRPHVTATNDLDNLPDTVTALQGSSRDQGGITSSAQHLQSATSSTPVSGLKLAPKELVQLAPRLKDYLHGPEPTWRDIVDAADWVRGDLEISRSLWGEACLLMGRETAAIAVAVVSTKAPGYFRTTAGGYFRGMVDKAKAHELHLDRTIWKLRTASKPPQAGRCSGTAAGVIDAAQRLIHAQAPERPSRVGGGAPWGG